MSDQFLNDLRYDRCIWPEAFAPAADPYLVLGERILLALQTLDLTCERLADATERKLPLPQDDDQ